MKKTPSMPTSQDLRFPLLALQIHRQERGAIWLKSVVQYLQKQPVKDTELLAKAIAAQQMIENQRAHPRRITILGRSGVPRVTLAATLVAEEDVDPNPESTRSYAGPQLTMSPLPSLNFAVGVSSREDRQKYLLSALESDYGVLLLTTPFVLDEEKLVQDYAALIGSRSIRTGAVLLLGTPDPIHRTAVENILKEVGIPLIAVTEQKRFTALVESLRSWLDPQLAASIYCPVGAKTPSMYPGAENSAPHSDLDLLAGLRAKLDGIEAGLIESTRCRGAFDSDADAGAKAIMDARRQLEEIDKKRSSAENRRKAQELLLTKIKAAARDSTAASDTGSLPYPAPKMKREAGEVFDEGWKPYCESIRIGARVDTDDLWLIWEDSRHAFAKRSLDAACEGGDNVIKHWILGEGPIKEDPRALHSEICDQIKANYQWIQQQWKQHQLRASHTPKAPANLAADVRRTLIHGIETSTAAIAGAGWAIVTGALVGGAVGAAGGVVAVKAGVISTAALAAPIVIAAGIVAVLSYAYWASNKRDEIIAAVRTCLKIAIDAQRDQMREMFRIAATVEFNKFSRKVRALLRRENCVVKRELEALDKEREQNRRRLTQLESERSEKEKILKDRQQELKRERDSVIELLNADYLKAVDVGR